MKKILDTDPITGIRHVFNYDDSTDEVTITAEQDVSSLLDVNKSEFNERHGRFGELTKVASIPNVILVELKKNGILNDQKAFKRWLNDPENRFFRTRPGTI